MFTNLSMCLCIFGPFIKTKPKKRKKTAKVIDALPRPSNPWDVQRDTKLVERQNKQKILLKKVVSYEIVENYRHTISEMAYLVGNCCAVPSLMKTCYNTYYTLFKAFQTG